MPKLLRSSETMGCGATIKLDSGEVVYVSIAQVGVLVRKSDMSGGLIKTLMSNFFGAKLYNESNVYKNAQTAQALSMMYPEQAPGLQFKNPVLAAFSNAIWHCASAAEVCVVLNEAASKISQLEQDDVAEFAETQAANISPQPQCERLDNCEAGRIRMTDPPRNAECNFALLRIAERQTQSDADWVKRTLRKIAPRPSPDFNERLHSAAGVVVQMLLHDASAKSGTSILDAQFDDIPKGFHIVVLFGLCLVIAVVVLLRKEGQTIDQKAVGLGMVGALLFMRSRKQQIEQYDLAHILLMKFVKAGGKFTEWQNDLIRLVRMYLLASVDERLQKYDYPALFGSMLKTLISAVELPT
jgi:hypothetical protein